MAAAPPSCIPIPWVGKALAAATPFFHLSARISAVGEPFSRPCPNQIIFGLPGLEQRFLDLVGGQLLESVERGGLAAAVTVAVVIEAVRVANIVGDPFDQGGDSIV